MSKFPLISVHSYADDIQLNVKFTSDINVAPNIMSNFITSIDNWLSNNSLSLNPNKIKHLFTSFSQTPINSPTFYHG